jgi:hypothetical protein
MVKNRFEFAILGMVLGLAVLDVTIIFIRGIGVDWLAYLSAFSIALGLILLGAFYRYYRKDEKLAAPIIGTGLFIAFTLVASVFNYLLMPVAFPLIDEWLLALDASFGYSWRTTVEWAATYPRLSLVLRHIYFSSLPQLIVVVLVLGFSGRHQALGEFLTVGIYGVMMCMAIWFFVPSLGPTTLLNVSDHVVDAASLGVTPSYGAELLRLAAHGESYLTPSKVLGLIAFPSFHMVMALMAVYYLWRVPYVRWVALGINLLMVPAILIHGGHFAVDLVAGLVVFLITVHFVKLFIQEKSIH